MMARRATVRIQSDGLIEELDDPDWFDRR
jgi:hypothetical protein